MMNYPLVYEISCREALTGVAKTMKREVTLADVAEESILVMEEVGLSAVWIMGVWKTGERGREVALNHEDLKKLYDRELPDWTPEDVVSSPYSIKEYSPGFGSVEDLIRLKLLLHSKGIELYLDFVGNHVALDHPWVKSHPEIFIQGSEEDLKAHPDCYVRLETGIFACGRDPFFPPWTDTLQIDYRKEAGRKLMIETALIASRYCDGFRCDMAMLCLKDIFLKTWGDDIAWEGGEFWPELIETVHSSNRNFRFIAEAYWDSEKEMIAQGFDYVYCKEYYHDVLKSSWKSMESRVENNPLLEHMVLFLENHDEERIMRVLPDTAQRRAWIFYTLIQPAFRLLNHGQIEGRRARSVLQLKRCRQEVDDIEEDRWYVNIMKHLKEGSHGSGHFYRIKTKSMEGDPSPIKGILWTKGQARYLALVNLSPERAEAWCELFFKGIGGQDWILKELTGEEVYIRSGSDMSQGKLYLKLDTWQIQLFEMTLKKQA